MTTLSLALPWAASADTVAVDGDGGDISNSKNSSFSLCAGTGSAVDVFGNIKYKPGNNERHFTDNGTVTITASVPTSAAGFLTADGATVVTADWREGGSGSVSSPPMRLTVGAAWLPGTYKVEYTFAGKDQSGRDYVLTENNNVQLSLKQTGCDSGGGDGGTGGGPINTAPTVDVTGFIDGKSYEIGTSIVPGCYVNDAEDTDEGALPVVTGPEGPLSAYGLGKVTVTCSYTDHEAGGGMSGTDTAVYFIVDTGAPVIADLGPTTLPDGAHGWYVSPVTNRFRATDSGAGFPTATPKLLSVDILKSTETSEGHSVVVNSGDVSDVAGNIANGMDSKGFAIDLSDPELNINGAESGTFDVCTDGVPTRPSFAPSDAVSGLDGTESESWTGPTTNSGVGVYVYTARATDNAGRTTTETRTYRAVYGSAFAGVQQPINGGLTADFADDNSRFKLGSTVPVKFKLVCGTTAISTALAKLSVKQADGKPDAGSDEAISTAASTSGNLFRYDATAGQYIFNLSTKAGYTNPNGGSVAFVPGTYTLSVLLDDDTSRSVNIQLVK